MIIGAGGWSHYMSNQGLFIPSFTTTGALDEPQGTFQSSPPLVMYLGLGKLNKDRTQIQKLPGFCADHLIFRNLLEHLLRQHSLIPRLVPVQRKIWPGTVPSSDMSHLLAGRGVKPSALFALCSF